jgi:hypothetical protein
VLVWVEATIELVREVEPWSSQRMRITTATAATNASRSTRRQRRVIRAGALSSVALQQQRQRGTRVGRASRMVQQLGWKRSAVDDWIPPVVPLDPLREKFGTHAVRLAGDRVDTQPGHQRALPVTECFSRCTGSRSCRSGRGRHGLPSSWCSISSAKTSRQLDMSRAAPSGRWQAPRPTTSSHHVGTQS